MEILKREGNFVMIEGAVSSKKISLKKLFIIIWAVYFAVFLGAHIYSAIRYVEYKKIQKVAVRLLPLVTDANRAYSDSELARIMYNTYGDSFIMDSSLDDQLKDRGLKMSHYWGTDYYRHTNIFEFVTYDVNWYFLMYSDWALIAGLLLAILLIYLLESKRSMSVEGDRIICKNGKDRKSVV